MADSVGGYNVPRGIAYLSYQQVVVYAASFVYYVLLIRVLDLSQIGEVSLLGAAMSIFTTLTQLSLPLAATRYISSKLGGRNPLEARGVARSTLRLTIVFAGPGLVLALLASPWIGATVFKTTDSTNLLLVTFSASFVLDLTTLYGAYFLALGKYADMVYQNLLYVPLSRGLGLTLAYKGLGPLGIALGWAIGAVATLLLSLYLWKGKLPHSNDSYPVRTLLAFSIPLFATAIITLFQGWGDIALLQTLLGQFEVTGAYYLVVSSVAFLSILWIPAASALYPALSSSYHNQGPEAVTARLGVATRLVNLTVLPAGAALATIASTALTTVYGTSLGSQSIPFAILSVTIIFSAQSLLLITVLQAIGDTRPIFWISVIATIADLTIVGFGARELGTIAGALGRVALPFVMLVLSWQWLRRKMHVPMTESLGKAGAIAFVSSGLLAIVDYGLNFNFHFSPFVRISTLLATFVLGYLATSRAIRAFNSGDFEHLRSALPGFMSVPLTRLERILVKTGQVLL